MRRLSIALLLLASVVLPAFAEINEHGSDPLIQNQYGTRDQRDCTVYMYGDPIGEAARFIALGYQVTVGNDLSYANISQYDVLVLPIVAPGSIPGAQATITQYVQAGGGLWIHQPSTPGTVDYAPPGFDFTVTSTIWCGNFSDNTIVDAGHPTMTGLDDAALPGRFDSAPVAQLGAAYTLTARGTGACTGDVHSAAGNYGDGQVFMDLANCGYNSGDGGSDQYVINVLDWLCAGGPTPVEESSWGQIKTTYR